jgi:hypothetical protein
MNTNKIFKADNEGKLTEFMSNLDITQIKLLVQQLKDDLDRYKVVSKNYSKEKYDKLSKPYIEKRQGYLNLLSRVLTWNIQGRI